MTLGMELVSEVCPDCLGIGEVVDRDDPYERQYPCPECGGTGAILWWLLAGGQFERAYE